MNFFIDYFSPPERAPMKQPLAGRRPPRAAHVLRYYHATK